MKRTPVGSCSERRLLASGLTLRVWLLVLLACRFLVAADLKPDEQIVLYPTMGWRTNGGWAAEIHGCVYELKGRGILAPLLQRVLGISEEELSLAEKTLFRERARLFMVDHEARRTVPVRLRGGLAPRVCVPEPTDGSGHFTGRLLIGDDDLPARSSTHRSVIYQTVLASNSTPLASAEIQLIDNTGLSVISDIDDTIKISAVRDRRELVRNTFCRPFKAVPGMAAMYQAWVRDSEAQIHYVSASPWQLYPALADFIRREGFPAGSFHLKHIRAKDGTFVDLFTSPTAYKPGVIEPLLERFPRRRFVLVGDSGERDPEIYGALARKFPTQIARICIRDVTDEARASLRYQQAFAGLPPQLWRVFKEPAEVADAVQ